MKKSNQFKTILVLCMLIFSLSFVTARNDNFAGKNIPDVSNINIPKAEQRLNDSNNKSEIEQKNVEESKIPNSMLNNKNTPFINTKISDLIKTREISKNNFNINFEKIKNTTQNQIKIKEELEETKKATSENVVRNHILNLIQLMQTKEEKLNSKLSLNPNLEEDKINLVNVQSEKNINKLEELKNRVASAKSKTEIKSLLDETLNTWNNNNVQAITHKAEATSSNLNSVLVKLNIAEVKLNKMIEKISNKEEFQEQINQFTNLIIEGNELIEEAKKNVGKNNALSDSKFKEGDLRYQEATKFLLTEIFPEIKKEFPNQTIEELFQVQEDEEIMIVQN